ncbi:MAG: phosphoribosylformylglycinamidine synthase subunit PurQ [Nitrospinae bacterium]|nr:phosphoribosylformylglycinamidine synthase subunit PurQ [Nitrospinota bacterium]
MKFGVVVFPGSNCDHDCYHVLKHVMAQEVEFIWHKSTALKGFDCLVLPGGFSYGDYLRCGAIAKFSPIVKEIRSFAEHGGLVIGICNGFQILVEAGLLPGALMRNKALRFICKDVHLRVENNGSSFTTGVGKTVLKIPIAHADGNYYADAGTLNKLEKNRQIVFRYSDAKGEVTDAANPNGSLNNIAGITNREKNVLGMMPHPERCAEAILGNADGKMIFESIIGRG